MSAGAEKSGKPCERFTAPYFSASRVISRITDSVNELAFFDTCLLFEGAGVVIVRPFSHKSHKKHKITGIISNELWCFLCLLWLKIRNDLFAGGFAFQLIENRANRGGIAAVRR